MAEHPKVFISYSHDSPEHKRWVSELGTKLRYKGVDGVLDQWNLTPGDNFTQFMEVGVRDLDWVLVICTDNYVRKANNREGGVGYEVQIVIAQLVENLGIDKFIPIIRQASGQEKMPTFLGGRVYIDFTDDSQFDEKFNELLHKLYDVLIVEKPPLGEKPSFAKLSSEQEVPLSEEVDTQLLEIPEQDDSDRFLTIPVTTTEATPATTVIMCHHRGLAVPGVELLVLFPDNTWKRATTDENGEAQVDLHSTHLPMTVFAASSEYAAHLEHDWVPAQGALTIEMQNLPNGGAVIFPEATGYLPGLSGRLNPKRDSRDRTYLYASNIAINGGKPQPVHFIPGEDLRLTDADGRELMVRIIAIIGRSALVEYRPYSKGDGK